MTTAGQGFTSRLLVDAGISQGMRVLDVGCGSGNVAFLLSGLVVETGEVVGVDHDAGLPRIIALGAATEGEVGIETLQQRLDEEQIQSSSIYIGDVAFGAWARKLGV
jgi:precorrin-6B methylase 2